MGGPDMRHGEATGRARRVQIFEERDFGFEDRLRATFELQLEGVAAQEGSFDEPDDEDYDPEAEWTDEDQQRQDERIEAAAQADPYRRLKIDDAIALARTLSDQVTVWLDHDPWDASERPERGDSVWPPAALNLRPRWYYETATTPPAPGWWVRFYIHAEGLTPQIARESIARLPDVLTVKSVTTLKPSDRKDRGGSRSERRRRKGHIDVECLVEADPGRDVTAVLELLDLLHELIPDQRVKVPRSVRLRMLRDHLLRRDTAYTVTGNGVGVSPRVLEPATPEEVARYSSRREH